MAYETKPNTGSLFKNDKKETDTHPDYRGSGLIDGVEYWFDAWINTSSSGSKYMSLKFKPKDAQQTPRPNSTTNDFEHDLADDVPF